jgi:hypothetical protein
MFGSMQENASELILLVKMSLRINETSLILGSCERRMLNPSDEEEGQRKSQEYSESRKRTLPKEMASPMKRLFASTIVFDIPIYDGSISTPRDRGEEKPQYP